MESTREETKSSQTSEKKAPESPSKARKASDLPDEQESFFEQASLSPSQKVRKSMRENRSFKAIATSEPELDEAAEFCAEPQHLVLVTSAGKPVFSL